MNKILVPTWWLLLVAMEDLTDSAFVIAMRTRSLLNNRRMEKEKRKKDTPNPNSRCLSSGTQQRQRQQPQKEVKKK